ncbi:MAG: DUF4159 domain-containing protein [Acidobacteria bacterium]|nr:DUF4159 domain-containing protein [Acidobacteriota bacterium]MBI3278361.1 DUF4159 domain-containing protein [Acidobacteriota bacterium]
MRPRTVGFAVLLAACLWSALYGFQQRRPRYYSLFYDNAPVVTPPDAGEKTEFAFARMRYPSYGRGPGGIWAMRGNWTIDFPKADRHFVQGVRRLTRIHTRSVEEIVDLSGDQPYDWPWLYVVEPGHWELTEAQAAKLRDYLLRGGFLMTDDFHGTFEWKVFMESMIRVFPDRAVVDLDNSDPIFHVLYDLAERFQVPGVVTFGTGRTYEYDGVEPRWRAIFDDKGRIMVAICHNMDLGDAWEHSDNPEYPENAASLAYRIGINYIIYAMTH